MTLRIRIVDAPDFPALTSLIDEGERDGFRFLLRLRDEWVTGVNRFDRAGFTPCTDDAATHEIAVPMAGERSS